jgi:hypothetical protein
MPHTLDALACVQVTEWQATLVVQATAVLDGQDRREVDAHLAGSGSPPPPDTTTTPPHHH